MNKKNVLLSWLLLCFSASYSVQEMSSANITAPETKAQALYQVLLYLVFSKDLAQGRAFCVNKGDCYFVDCGDPLAKMQVLTHVRCDLESQECWEVPIDKDLIQNGPVELLAAITCDDSKEAQKGREQAQSYIKQIEQLRTSKREQIVSNNKHNSTIIKYDKRMRSAR